MSMKSKLRCTLFALVVPMMACGSDRESALTAPAPPHPKSPAAVTPVSVPVTMPSDAEVVARPPIVETAPSIAHPIPASYAECVALGKASTAKGDHAYARELFEAAARLDKKRSEPYVELARSWIATNDRGPAIKAARKAVKLAPESSQAYNTLGRAELLRHSYDDAVMAFRQATELDAKNLWAWNNLGFTYLTQRRYREAIDALDTATKLDGAEAYMWNNLGTAYEQLDELDEARAAFEQGGKLGSVAARVSRKRLEGVDTIVVVNRPDRAVEKSAPVKPSDVGYDTHEPIPDGALDHDHLDVGPTPDEVKPDEVKPDEVKPDEVKPAVPAEGSGSAAPVPPLT